MSTILDYTFGPRLKSGQTSNFTPTGRSTVDDGGSQEGIIGSKLNGQYEILTTGQYSGTTNITVNGNTDTHSNECVYDKVTGLMWNRETSDNVFGTGTQNLLWEDTTNNEDIFEFCDQANLSSLSGFTDWRVPNSSDLMSLTVMENTTSSTRVNSTAFPSWGEDIWSSTTNPANTTFALRVNYSS